MSQALKWAIFVISLPRSAHRWRTMSHRLNAIGLPFQRIEAIDGATLSEAAIAEVFDRKRAQSGYHYELTRGEIGCYLSHLKAWQTILEQDLDYAVILEDDVVLTDSFRFLPQTLAKLNDDWDLIKLAAPYKKQKATPLGEVGSFGYVRYRKPPMGACGHVVSAAGAAKLLTKRPPFYRPVDVDLQWQDELDLRVRGLLPYTVDNSHEHASDIFAVGDRRAQQKRPLQRLKHQIKLYFDSMRANHKAGPQRQQ